MPPTAATTITEEIPQVPLIPPMRPKAGGAPAVTADALKEYLAGSPYTYLLGNVYRTLGRAQDDVESRIGVDTYERMIRDPQVWSSVNLLKMSAISQELMVQPAAKEEDPSYSQAEEYADFCRRNLARVPDFRTRFLFEMLDAIPFGHRLAEQTFEVATSGEDRGKIVWKNFKVKPRANYGFIVDAYMDVVGILGVVPGLAWNALGGVWAYGAEQLALVPNVLPPDKFALLTMHPKENDPRGSSSLRPAYDSWFLKTQLFPEFWKYLMQFASPSVIGMVGPGQVRTPLVDADNNPVTDANGNIVYLDPIHDLLTALLQYRNGGAMALPHGSDVKTLFQMNNDGQAYRFAIDLLNHEINQAILFQSLATQEAAKGSRAAAQVHQDALEMLVQYVRTCVEGMVGRMFRFLLRMNFGDDAVALTPRVNLGDTEESNFFQKAMGVARLLAYGYFDPSQFAQLDVELGLPRRTQEEVDQRTAMKGAATAAIEQAQSTPKPPEAPPLADEIIPTREQRAAVAA